LPFIIVKKAILQELYRERETLILHPYPGSLGGTDLWKVTVNADGTFGSI
jgi:hypothetical protein